MSLRTVRTLRMQAEGQLSERVGSLRCELGAALKKQKYEAGEFTEGAKA